MSSFRSRPRAAAFCIALAAAWPAQATHVGEDLSVDQQAQASTDQLLGALSQWEKAPDAVRAARLQQLVQKAAERRERLARLIERNPQVAAARLMPAALRDRLPAAARAFVEEDTQLSGSVFAAVASDVERNFTSRKFLLRDAGGQEFELALGDGAGAQANERALLGWAGRRVTLNASKLDRKLLVRARADVQVVALDGVAGPGGATTPSTTPVVTGDQKTLVILTSFTDKPMSCSAADVQTRLFSASGSSVNTSFRESSRNVVSFSGTVVGPFPINYTSTGACDYSAWQTAAEAAARAAGTDPAQYRRISIVTPGNSTCGWSGLAYMPGTRSWVQSCAATGVYTHELGHNLALHHAVTPTSEYGDGSDPMGGARNVRNNAANQVMAGWVPTGALLDVTSGGSFSIAAVGPEAGTQPQVLRLPKADTSEKYYVSHRAAQGLDAGLAAGYLGNVQVHKATGTLPAKTTLLATLALGQSYADAANSITITNQGVAGGVATVDVAMAGGATPVCTRATPSVSLNPASRSVAAGTATTFSATIVNRNSSACGSATFNLASALPAGFSASVAPASVTIGAGASTTATWTVASPAAAAPASYDVALSASESSVANSSTTHGSYIVVDSGGGGGGTADTAGPTLAITSPGTGAVLSGGRVTIGATASDASGVARVDFFDGAGRLLASDTLAPYTANWNLRKVARGPHTLTVRAVDNAGNTTQASVTVTVQ